MSTTITRALPDLACPECLAYPWESNTPCCREHRARLEAR